VTSGKDVASDGPWGEMQLGFADRYNVFDDARAAGAVIERAVFNPAPDRDMIARAEQAGRWLALIPDDGDRRLVVLAVEALGKGAACVPWTRLLARMGLTMGAAGLARRYDRVMKALAGVIG
jgi:hypothetical protein